MTCTYFINVGFGSTKWSHQRQVLNGQEAKLLNNVHNLRRRVAQHIKDTSSSSSNY